VVANDGVMPPLGLLAGSDGLLGHSPAPLRRASGRRVLEARWLPTLRGAMAAVSAPGGTGFGLAPTGFPVAMKTGTASQWRVGYHVNYIGYGPLPRGRVAFCVRVTHQPSSWRAVRAGREVTTALLAGLALRAW
jgi:cell division protein FtsI/penicillin-binding protein 2